MQATHYTPRGIRRAVAAAAGPERAPVAPARAERASARDRRIVLTMLFATVRLAELNRRGPTDVRLRRLRPANIQRHGGGQPAANTGTRSHHANGD